MRVSTRSNDVGHMPNCHLLFEVKVNGKFRDDIIAADEEAGEIEYRLETPIPGEFFVEFREIKEHGLNVEILPTAAYFDLCDHVFTKIENSGLPHLFGLTEYDYVF